MACTDELPWDRRTSQQICMRMRPATHHERCDGKTSTLRAMAMKLCGFYATDKTDAVRTIVNNNPFALPRNYNDKLKEYMSSDAAGLVVEWVRNSSVIHTDSELTEMLNEFIVNAPHLHRNDKLIRVVRNQSHMPSSDRLMSCAMALDDVQRVSWALVWGSRGPGRWRLDDSDAEHCCLLELNVASNVPRLYCIAIDTRDIRIPQHQSEVILPLQCQYTHVDERVERWNVKQLHEHGGFTVAHMKQYYVFPSDEGYFVKVRILTYNVQYPLLYERQLAVA